MKKLQRYIHFFIMCFMVSFFSLTLLYDLSQYLFPELVHAISIVKRFFLTILWSVYMIAISRQRDVIKYFNGDESGYPQGKALPEPDGKTPRIVLYLIVFCTFFFMVGVVSTFVDLIDYFRNVPPRFANIVDRLLWMLYFNVGVMLCLILFKQTGVAVLKVFEDTDRKWRQIRKYLAEQKAARKRAKKNHNSYLPVS